MDGINMSDYTPYPLTEKMFEGTVVYITDDEVIVEFYIDAKVENITFPIKELNVKSPLQVGDVIRSYDKLEHYPRFPEKPEWLH